MKSFVIFVLIIAAARTQAQPIQGILLTPTANSWSLLPSGGPWWKSVSGDTLFVQPDPGSYVQCNFEIIRPDSTPPDSSYTITFRQDSVRGSGFSPEHHSELVKIVANHNIYPLYLIYSFTFYSADTAVTIVSATDGQTEQKFVIVGLPPIVSDVITKDINKSVSVFPNPSRGLIHIEGIEPNESCAIYDVFGNCVCRPSAKDGVALKLPSGYYYLEVFRGMDHQHVGIMIAD